MSPFLVGVFSFASSPISVGNFCCVIWPFVRVNLFSVGVFCALESVFGWSFFFRVFRAFVRMSSFSVGVLCVRESVFGCSFLSCHVRFRSEFSVCVNPFSVGVSFASSSFSVGDFCSVIRTSVRVALFAVGVFCARESVSDWSFLCA